MFVIVALLAVILVLLTRFYFNQKKENSALRLKILSMSETKRTPKSWAQLTTRLRPSALTVLAPVTDSPSTPTTAPAASGTSAENIDNLDTTDLALKLDGQMRRPKNFDLKTIENNIAIADEIISREPDSYGAYKAKLISMLVKEGKFNQAIDESEVESLLESMAQFNISSDKIARRESALIGNTNGEIQNVEVQLEGLARERETIESQISSYDINSPDLAQLNNQIQEIETREAQLLENIDSLENSLASSTDQLINEDVIEIPFMRMMAKNDYDSVIENAESFIEQFPSSPSGYFYMVKALEMQGRKEEALSIIENSQLPQSLQDRLFQRLDEDENQNPQTYWQNLSF